MYPQPRLNILYLRTGSENRLSPLIEFLHQLPHVYMTTRKDLPEDLENVDVVLTESADRYSPLPAHLNNFVRSGGVWFSLTGLKENSIDPIFGIAPGSVGPMAELRALFKDTIDCIADRLPDAFYISGMYQDLSIESEDVKTLLVADWHFKHPPLMTYRVIGNGCVVLTSIQDFANPFIQKITVRLIRQLSAIRQSAAALSVGILGYAPSVGELHGRGIQFTDGLSLTAICDVNPDQLQLAGNTFPEVVLHHSANGLADDSNIDLVIIATPPNTHAELCIQMMKAGKHVICEKPLAMNTKETERMRETADVMNLHLSCHQNRRFDQDFLAIRETVTEGLIGDLFYMETFVGGFCHPCGCWHSHVHISGGTCYDWGAHYLDWVVGLIPEKVAAVSSSSQKRVWHDVSNADHEQIHIRFENEAEALFIHSDIAAIRKPKWYVLGTKGAIAGYWQDVTAFEIDPLLYYERHDIPATEMPPDLRLNIRHPGGKITEQKITLPVREPYPFHNNIADHLLCGEPLGAPLEDSIKVVAILEAASLSAANGGKPEAVK